MKFERGEIGWRELVWIFIAGLFIWIVLANACGCSRPPTMIERSIRGHYVTSALIGWSAVVAEATEIAGGEYTDPCRVRSLYFARDCCYMDACTIPIDDIELFDMLADFGFLSSLYRKPSLDQVMRGLTFGVWIHIADDGPIRLVYGAHRHDETIFVSDPVAVFERYRDHRSDWRYKNAASSLVTRLSEFPKGKWLLIHDKRE